MLRRRFPIDASCSKRNFSILKASWATKLLNLTFDQPILPVLTRASRPEAYCWVQVLRDWIFAPEDLDLELVSTACAFEAYVSESGLSADLPDKISEDFLHGQHAVLAAHLLVDRLSVSTQYQVYTPLDMPLGSAQQHLEPAL